VGSVFQRAEYPSSHIASSETRPERAPAEALFISDWNPANNDFRSGSLISLGSELWARGVSELSHCEHGNGPRAAHLPRLAHIQSLGFRV